ncbi:CRAL/TRIO domain-containing protein [Violaceomyces palustris]|uniref:CRAL/TRIO domain-containing protein n=1 Tax=Violaceomyces palustris TaxID=1673888 RepID=A0ACD0NXK2_9BASI|nr:CRAL/TRIO domain-containing protein [Violaceomyces palustris]
MSAFFRRPSVQADSSSSTANSSPPSSSDSVPPKITSTTTSSSSSSPTASTSTLSNPTSVDSAFSRSPLKTFSSFGRSSGRKAAAGSMTSSSSSSSFLFSAFAAGSNGSSKNEIMAERESSPEPQRQDSPSKMANGRATFSRSSSVSTFRSRKSYGDEGDLEDEYQSNLPPLGHPGNLTPSQAEALVQLTTRLKQDGVLSDDNDDGDDSDGQGSAPTFREIHLLRFLRARSFNVEAAREMYLKAQEWRREVKIDQLCRDFVFVEKEEVANCGWRMYFHNVDKLGRPIFIQDLSNINTSTLFQRTTPERIVQNFAVTLEMAVRHRYRACTKVKGRLVDDNMMVLNVAGLGMGTFWAMKSQLQLLLSTLDNNFPELSGRVQIINAPYIFSTVWSWIKGWLPVGTVEKVDIAGSDYLGTILKYVDKDSWPKYLGGECTCSQHDGGCVNSDVGPWDRELFRRPISVSQE